MIVKSYKDGIKEGRRQIIANIKKHYDETEFVLPKNLSGCEIGIFLPETTLCKYFKELKNKKEK